MLFNCRGPSASFYLSNFSRLADSHNIHTRAELNFSHHVVAAASTTYGTQAYTTTDTARLALSKWRLSGMLASGACSTLQSAAGTCRLSAYSKYVRRARSDMNIETDSILLCCSPGFLAENNSQDICSSPG